MKLSKKCHGKIRDIVYETSALGELIPDERLIRKILRSLPPCFPYKVTAIEDAKISSQ